MEPAQPKKRALSVGKVDAGGGRFITFREAIDRLAPCAERGCKVAAFDRAGDSAARGAKNVTDQACVVVAPCSDGTDMQKVDPIAWKRRPKGPFSLGSRVIARANGLQFDENGRFEGGSVLDLAESEGLLEDPGTTDSARDRNRGDRTKCRVCLILGDMGSTMPAIVRGMRRAKVAIRGNTIRESRSGTTSGSGGKNFLEGMIFSPVSAKSDRSEAEIYGNLIRGKGPS